MAEDMSKMLGRLQELQEQMARAQEEVGALQATAESGGGVVKVTASGKLQVLKIEIAKEIIDPNEAEMLEDLVVAAVNRAIDRARELGESKMADVTRSMLPPGFPPIV
jgi:DNA-binding YbaB/EbfC family protein